ncbi:hypothetical protein BGZ83_009142 [Gryganskiella cystojenkinii]|nr:hypothetical protein BGZ83_009142 [Gryganskiella cystojenkinii]
MLDDADLYKRLTPPPIQPQQPVTSYSTADPKKIAKAAQRQKRDLLVQKLQQQQAEVNERARQEKIERDQAKQERRQKKEEYKQMYQSQHDYQQQLEERRTERRQQRSLPIYPTAFATSSTSSVGNESSSAAPTFPQSISNEIYYHTSRHYHRERTSATSTTGRDNLDSMSSTATESSTATRSSHIIGNNKTKVSSEQMRSLSLKSTSTKSMYDLRPWSGGAPRSPIYDQQTFEVDRDETASSQGWDSLMDTLHSPTVSAPLESPLWDSSSSKEELEPDSMSLSSQLNASMGLLPQENSKNGNGRYLLVLGANGRTGIELVRQGLELNYRVTAFVREDKVLLEDPVLRKNQNLLIVRGSPTCQADLDRCVEGQDVVINVIGARLMGGDPTIGSHTQVILNNSMKKHGVRRLLVVTSYGCLGLRNYLISKRKLFSRVFMNGILKDKVLQEDIIQRSSVHFDWTIIRPITLKDDEQSEKFFMSPQGLPKTNRVKPLSRKDLAFYLLSCINENTAMNEIRSVAGKPKTVATKPFCPFEKKRVAAEIVKQAEEDAEDELLRRKAQLLWLQQQHLRQQQQQHHHLLKDVTLPPLPLPMMIMN